MQSDVLEPSYGSASKRAASSRRTYGLLVVALVASAISVARPGIGVGYEERDSFRPPSSRLRGAPGRRRDRRVRRAGKVLPATSHSRDGHAAVS